MNEASEIRDCLVAVKGAGDLATGVIHRLSRAGFAIIATELAEPTVVRRTVAFAEAVTRGEMIVEDVTARLATSLQDIQSTLASGLIPIVVDPDGTLLKQVHPSILIEATLSKHNSGVTMNIAPIVIALGPGYEAGKDVHAVIETKRGHNLGRVYLHGCAEPDTGVPGAIGGYTIERLLRAPCSGRLYGVRQIGDLVQAGEMVAMVRTNDNETAPVVAAISGILRGLIRDGLHVSNGMKVGDIDPRAAREHCFTISDKSRAIAGGVLEAILYLLNRRYSVHAQNRGLS
jgi:xanthine dehydrogenase accessory factor